MQRIIVLMKPLTLQVWARWAIFNLLIVSCLGLLMRLKILLPLPWVDQRFTLHAHSHFAFAGWVSQALMFLIAAVLFRKEWEESLPGRYTNLLLLNLLASYGMLISFFLQGYAAASITFSTLSVLVSYLFLWFCQKDITREDRSSSWWKWLQIALIFNVLSSVGTFFLAYVMAAEPGNTRLRLASVYFYLHFQYNGWFFFGCLGLFQHWLAGKKIAIPFDRALFWLLTLACFPAYFLSLPWLRMPSPVTILLILTAIIQLGAWMWWWKGVHTFWKQVRREFPGIVRAALLLVAIATTSKFILQIGSGIPALSQMVFGLRPIVIAYLHLVLLGMVSLFLVAWFYLHGGIATNRNVRWGIRLFAVGIILNELLLMIQGASYLVQIYPSRLPELLVLAALILTVSIATIYLGSTGR